MEKNWPTVTGITRFIEYLEFNKVLNMAFLSCLYQLGVHVVLFFFGSIFLRSTSMHHVTDLQKKKRKKKTAKLAFSEEVRSLIIYSLLSWFYCQYVMHMPSGLLDFKH